MARRSDIPEKFFDNVQVWRERDESGILKFEKSCLMSMIISSRKIEANNSIRFRPMNRKEIPQLVELDALSNRPSWTTKMFERELTLPFSLSAVADFQAQPVAFGVVWILPDLAQLIQLAVAPAYRRKGIGEGLLTYLIASAGRQGCRKMELEFREENIAARKLYEKMGFRITGKRKGFYDGCDGVLMSLSLIPTFIRNGTTPERCVECELG